MEQIIFGIISAITGAVSAGVGLYPYFKKSGKHAAIKDYLDKTYFNPGKHWAEGDKIQMLAYSLDYGAFLMSQVSIKLRMRLVYLIAVIMGGSLGIAFDFDVPMLETNSGFSAVELWDPPMLLGLIVFTFNRTNTILDQNEKKFLATYQGIYEEFYKEVVYPMIKIYNEKTNTLLSSDLKKIHREQHEAIANFLESYGKHDKKQ